MDQEPIPKTISLFVLGIVDRVTQLFMRPRLDLVFGGDVPPYLHTYPIWDAATGRQIRGRWYRVGVLNHSKVPVSEVQVQLWKLEPVPFPLQPVTLHFKDNNPESGRPQPRSVDVPAGRHDPTAFVDVVSQYERQPAFEVHTVPNVPLRHIPAGQYTLTIRVTGRDAGARTRRFAVGLNEHNELTMANADQPVWCHYGRALYVRVRRSFRTAWPPPRGRRRRRDL